MYIDVQENTPESDEMLLSELAPSASISDIDLFQCAVVHSSRKATTQACQTMRPTDDQRGGESSSRESSQSASDSPPPSNSVHASSSNTSHSQNTGSDTTTSNRGDFTSTLSVESIKENQFLMLCTNADEYLIDLTQINVTNIKDDEYLFFKIREAYKSLQHNNFSAFSLWHPTSVEIVKVRIASQ